MVAYFGKAATGQLLTIYRLLFIKYNMVTIIASTNRPGSSTLQVAQYYQKQLAAKGMQTNLLSLAQLPPNLIETDLYGKRSSAFAQIQDVITNTDKFLFVIPEYNGSYPGVLKVFMDACSFPESFYDKKAALVGLSSGKYGNIRGIDHFTGVCHYLNLHVMPLKIHIASIRKEMDTNGNLTAEDTLRYTNEQMDKFIKF